MVHSLVACSLPLHLTNIHISLLYHGTQWVLPGFSDHRLFWSLIYFVIDVYHDLYHDHTSPPPHTHTDLRVGDGGGGLMLRREPLDSQSNCLLVLSIRVFIRRIGDKWCGQRPLNLARSRDDLVLYCYKAICVHMTVESPHKPCSVYAILTQATMTWRWSHSPVT